MWAKKQKSTIAYKEEVTTLVLFMRKKCYKIHIAVNSTSLLNSKETRKRVLNFFSICSGILGSGNLVKISRLERTLAKRKKKP